MKEKLYFIHTHRKITSPVEDYIFKGIIRIKKKKGEEEKQKEEKINF